jgi:ATP adenylyltransferase
MSSTLPEKILRQTQHALNCGALQPILTDYEILEQQNIPFLVRIITNLARKEQAKKQPSTKPVNPFLPYEEDLFVTHLSDTHLCLLNKFNAVEHHILIITKEYEEQDNWLNIQDFEAMWATLTEIDGLGFYNGGTIAGSSQPHKHLQFVPLPWVPEIPKTPLESALIAANLYPNQLAQISAFPFAHALIPFDFQPKGVQAALDNYHRLLDNLGLIDVKPQAIRQTAPYNLLVTREWMMIVPRSQESFQSIAVNSLGFAGALLVRDLEQLELLKTLTPLTLLQSVSIPNL